MTSMERVARSAWRRPSNESIQKKTLHTLLSKWVDVGNRDWERHHAAALFHMK